MIERIGKLIRERERERAKANGEFETLMKRNPQNLIRRKQIYLFSLGVTRNEEGKIVIRLEE